MPQFDWDAEARADANRAHQELFEAHRGAIPSRMIGFATLFANDGHGHDQRSRDEVEYVRAALASEGVKELGFGTSGEDGYTWAMVVRSDGLDRLTELVWRAWGWANGTTNDEGTADSSEEYQRGIARRAIDDDPRDHRESVN
jgi:hypothetical protein